MSQLRTHLRGPKSGPSAKQPRDPLTLALLLVSDTRILRNMFK